jgi:hypothetical protein
MSQQFRDKRLKLAVRRSYSDTWLRPDSYSSRILYNNFIERREIEFKATFQIRTASRSVDSRHQPSVLDYPFAVSKSDHCLLGLTFLFSHLLLTQVRSNHGGIFLPGPICRVGSHIDRRTLIQDGGEAHVAVH